MNKTNLSGCMSHGSYSSPECQVLEVKTEGVLCYSSSAENIFKNDELTNDDYSQIF